MSVLEIALYQVKNINLTQNEFYDTRDFYNFVEKNKFFFFTKGEYSDLIDCPLKRSCKEIKIIEKHFNHYRLLQHTINVNKINKKICQKSFKLFEDFIRVTINGKNYDYKLKNCEPFYDIKINTFYIYQPTKVYYQVQIKREGLNYINKMRPMGISCDFNFIREMVVLGLLEYEFMTLWNENCFLRIGW